MNRSDRIYVAGHRGLVGSAIERRLRRDGFTHLLTRSRSDLDLRQRSAVDAFFARERPQYVFLAAARVGGIHANSNHGAEFIYDNLLIQTHVIDAAYRFGASKLLFFGSSCIYPRTAPQPMPESALLCGPLEPTNAPYAVAKIAGIQMCQAYRAQYGFDAICAMPTNLFGPHDNFDCQQSHVLPALIRKFDDALHARSPLVTLWGSGRPLREFLHVDDLAEAALMLMERYSNEQIINVGSGDEISIDELARLIGRLSGFRGEIRYDATKPDGIQRKALDSSRLRALGWRPLIALREGIESTLRWYRSQRASTHASAARASA